MKTNKQTNQNQNKQTNKKQKQKKDIHAFFILHT